MVFLEDLMIVNCLILDHGKYPWIVHSEVNCLLNANIIPEPEKCKLYVTGPVCQECLKQIIQVGIGKVIYAGVKSACMHQESEYQQILQKMMQMSKIQFIEMNCPSIHKNSATELLNNTIEYLNKRWI